MGMNVGVYDGTVAVSADCDENILLYRVVRTDGQQPGDHAVRPWQRLDYTEGSGAVTSIAMDGDRLVYTTVRDDVGSLFVYDRLTFVQDGGSSAFRFVHPLEAAGGGYWLTQTLDLGGASGDLFVYDAAVDGDAIAVAVVNDVALFTLDAGGAWGREPAGMETEGYFAGSGGSSVSMDGGRLFVTSDREVTVRDMSGCQSYLKALAADGGVSEETGETPEAAATSAPVGVPIAPSAFVPEPVAFPLYCIDVLVTFDNYSEDTSWEVARSADGEVVASSGTHDGISSSDRVCLEPGEYEFAISDVYGDGMWVSFACFSWGFVAKTLVAHSLCFLFLFISQGAANGARGVTSCPTAAPVPKSS